MSILRNLRSPSLAVAMAALVVALGGTAIAAGEISGSDSPETVLKVRVTKDGKLIGTDNDGTVKKAGVGIYDITQRRADRARRFGRTCGGNIEAIGSGLITVREARDEDVARAWRLPSPSGAIDAEP